MPSQNISAKLKPVTKNEILNLLTQIFERLPFIINLTPEERLSLPKMGDKTIAFVDKVLELAQQNPQLVPPYVNVDELRRDYELSMHLRVILNAVRQIYEKLDDTTLASGSEAYLASLSFYNKAKNASKMNVPGTDTFVRELSKIFEVQGKEPTPGEQ